MGAKRAILGFLALRPVLSAARFSAPSQATSLLSLSTEMLDVLLGKDTYVVAQVDILIASGRCTRLLMIHAPHSLHSFH